MGHGKTTLSRTLGIAIAAMAPIYMGRMRDALGVLPIEYTDGGLFFLV